MYQALYRTWRPQTFDEVIGQPSVSQTLKAQVDAGRLSHAYLFTGTRGTGKTTCARILAKAVNCLHPKDGNPCNRCAHCQAIDNGTTLDVLEIDAASNNGVDNIRTLRDEANYTPAELKRRVYIIDEVHMLSNSAFNALLKIIEEPPEHLMFILATTELNKVPATILSRCQRYSFRRLSQRDLEGRINEVAYAENIDIDSGAIRALARLGDGAMRDALSLLDQCSSASGGETLTAERVYEILGLVGQKQTAGMMELVLGGNSAEVLHLFDSLYQAGKSLSSLLDELCCLARDLLLLKTIPQGGEDLLCGVCSQEECQHLLGLASAGELSTVIRLLQQTAAGFSQSVDPRLEAELCLLRLCKPELRLDADSLNSRLSRVEEQLASGVVMAAVPGEVRFAAGDEELPPWEDSDAPPQSAAPAAPSADPAPTAEDASAGFWPRLLEVLKPELPTKVRGFFALKGPIEPGLEGDTLTLRAEHFAYSMINQPDVLRLTAQKAGAVLGRPIQVRAVEIRQEFGGSEVFDRFADNAQRQDGGRGIVTVRS